MEKLKLASSSLGERLKTGGVQMSRMVSTKMKEILQAPTPESKIVDEATQESMEEPNWGLNLRICAMINSEEFSGTEIVKAIKKKILSKSSVSQRLSLELLEMCSSNCEKVFSEVASEKVLEDMARLIEDPNTDNGIRQRIMEMIRAWGENEDIMYLPVFRQTYMSLKTRRIPTPGRDQDANIHPEQNTLESYVGNEQLMSTPERYPITDESLNGANGHTSPYYSDSLSVEENKEYLVVTRNILELLSSILDSGIEPTLVKEDLTVSMLEKCKQSLPVVQRIAESTTDDEVMLFDALNLHDEIQQVISRCEQLEAALETGGTVSTHSDAKCDDSPGQDGNHRDSNRPASPSVESTLSSSDMNKAKSAEPPNMESTESSKEMKEAKRADPLNGESTGYDSDLKTRSSLKEESH